MTTRRRRRLRGCRPRLRAATRRRGRSASRPRLRRLLRQRVAPRRTHGSRVDARRPSRGDRRRFRPRAPSDLRGTKGQTGAREPSWRRPRRRRSPERTRSGKTSRYPSRPALGARSGPGSAPAPPPVRGSRSAPTRAERRPRGRRTARGSSCGAPRLGGGVGSDLRHCGSAVRRKRSRFLCVIASMSSSLQPRARSVSTSVG